MGNKTLYLLLGFVFLLAALAWFFFGPDGTERKPEIDDFREISLDASASIKIPPYLREGERTDPTAVLHFEHRAKEIFLELEIIGLERFGLEGSAVPGETFDVASSLYWETHADSVVIDDRGVKKSVSPLTRIDSLTIPAFTFSMEVHHPENRRLNVYSRTVLYRIDNKMYILSLVTNAAFREKYKPLFDLIVGSFREK
jgi:hypothetical protein